MGCGLVHLDPSWINALLRELLDHRLPEREHIEWWKTEMEDCRCQSSLRFDDLIRAHQIHVATGRLSKQYLAFLWRKIPGLADERVLDRMIDTMARCGAMFPCRPNEERATEYMVPARLPCTVANATMVQLERAISDGVKIQFVFEIDANYLPPGIVAQFLGDFCRDGCIVFRACWNRGAAFKIGGREYLVCLHEQTAALPTRIEINVAGRDEDMVWKPGFDAQNAMRDLLHDQYPGLLSYPPGDPVVTKGTDAWLDTFDRLQEHLKSEMSKVSEQFLHVFN